MEYGLIGEHLSHSFSKPIHEGLAGYEYILKEVPPQQIQDFFKKKDFKAVNVTVPYKFEALKAADVVDENAALIGSSNCLVNKDGLLYAFNTDYDGIAATFEKAGIDVRGKKAAILGIGGVSKPLEVYLKNNGAKEIVFVYYKEKENTVSYDELYKNHGDIDILINATPVGTFPDVDKSPADLSKFKNLEFVFDVIYNPFETQLLSQARKLKIPYANGLWMLVIQAVAAIKHFTHQKIDSKAVENMYVQLMRDMANIALIGMPSSGKTTLAALLAEKMEREFLEADEMIAAQSHMTIPEIFENFQEEGFRNLESQIIKKSACTHSSIISCGGGVIKRSENMDALNQTSLVVYIKRPLELLVTEDENRPLISKGIENLYQERKELYENYADLTIENNGTIDEALEKITEGLKDPEIYKKWM